MSNPFFSVVVPVYNVASYLIGCKCSLETAGRKFARAIEIVWVDDGSDDGSGNVLDNLKFSASNICSKVVHQSNKGVSAARNVGMGLSTGDWVMFLDPDDIYHPDVFCRCFEVIEKTGADILKFGYRLTTRHSTEWLLPRTDVVRVYDMSCERDFVRVLNEHLAVLRMWNGCFKREVVSKVRFRDTSNGEDGLFAQETLGVANKVAITDTILHSYLQRPGSAVHTVNLALTQGHVLYNRYRFEVMRRWKYFGSIKPLLRRGMRSSVGGSTMGLILALPQSQRHIAQAFFWDNLAVVFSSGELFCGLEGALYRRTFNDRSWVMALIALRVAWWIRKSLLRIAIVVRLKRLLYQ